MLNHRIRHRRFFHVGFPSLTAGSAFKGFTVIVNDSDFGRNKFYFGTNEFLTDRNQGGIAFLTETVYFSKRAKAFIMRNILEKFQALTFKSLSPISLYFLEIRL